MRSAIVQPGVASIVVGATLLLGTMPVASARHPPSGSEFQSGFTPEAAPESTFSIFGPVESPGRYDWSAGMTVGQAVAAAGGYADGGSPDELQIQRLVGCSPRRRVVAVRNRTRFSGRAFSVQEMTLIREIVRDCSGLSRMELARTVCELLRLRRPNGRLKARALPVQAPQAGRE